MPSSSSAVSTRHYDIDWLRFLAFGLLIFYHLGMYYVKDWGWHIKSPFPQAWLQDVMILPNQWRMSLLFFISGLALSVASNHQSNSTLFLRRTSRLLLPLLFGMFVIVAPQVYIEARSQHLIEESFIQFWLAYINPNTPLLKAHQSIIGLLTWNHLWFVPYLWVYTLLYILFRPFISKALSLPPFSERGLPPLVGVTMVLVGMAVVWVYLRNAFPSTHALIGDWYNHGKYGLAFFIGVVFARSHHWWQCTIRYRMCWLVSALCCYLLIIADRHEYFTEWVEHNQDALWFRPFVGLILALNMWSWIFAVVGYAGKYLNAPSPFIINANRAIYPSYLLHQTLIIVCAWWLLPYSLPPLWESVVILIFTLMGCWLGVKFAQLTPFTAKLMGYVKKTSEKMSVKSDTITKHEQ